MFLLLQNNFTNYGDISADTLSLSVAGDFDYSSDFQNNGNINVTNQYFTIRNGDFTNNTTIALVGNLGITADNFINSGASISADNLSVSLSGYNSYFRNENGASISADNLSVSLLGDNSYFRNENGAGINAKAFLLVFWGMIASLRMMLNANNLSVSLLAMRIVQA